jgi:chromosome segregation ATPase
VAQSLEAQRATAQRLDRVISQAHSELRMLDARLDEAVARTLELSAHAAADDTVEGLSADVDGLVTEMESLRQALEETSGSPNHGLAAGGTTE